MKKKNLYIKKENGKGLYIYYTWRPAFNIAAGLTERYKRY